MCARRWASATAPISLTKEWFWRKEPRKRSPSARRRGKFISARVSGFSDGLRDPPGPETVAAAGHDAPAAAGDQALAALAYRAGGGDLAGAAGQSDAGGAIGGRARRPAGESRGR